MIRIVIENILLLLLPTAFYIAYLYLTIGSKGAKQKVLNDSPIVWLFVAGVGLVLLVLIIFGSTSGGRPGEAYQPPVFKDGKIVPGHIKKDEPSAGG